MTKDDDEVIAAAQGLASALRYVFRFAFKTAAKSSFAAGLGLLGVGCVGALIGIPGTSSFLVAGVFVTAARIGRELDTRLDRPMQRELPGQEKHLPMLTTSEDDADGSL